MTPTQNATAGLNRRNFLKYGGSAGLVLGLQLPLAGCSRETPPAPAPGAAAGEPFAPNAFVRISPDDTVTLVIKHHEMGQGVTTGLATILADELDADLDAVAIEYAPANPAVYGNTSFGGAQGTGGSTSVASSWAPMREAGATARAMLVEAAAARWGVPADSIQVSRGTVSSGSHSARFGELAEAAAALTPPTEVPLKKPGQFVYIGQQKTRRVDSLAKSTGRAMYTIDVKFDGLLTAVIARPPAFGGKLQSMDAEAAKAVAGVVDVLEIPQGVAVVAQGMWPALQGRKALRLEWDDSEASLQSSEALYGQYESLADEPGTPVTASEQTESGLASAASTVEARYRFPYLAHASMEPMNCVAWLHDDRLETWSGHQFQSIDLPTAAGIAGLPPEQVTLNSLISGGSFGRRANGWADYTAEAVQVAKALKEQRGLSVPVRVQWSREDDMQGGLYRPLYVHKARVGLNANGDIAAWEHKVVGQSIMQAANMLRGDVDETSVEGISPTPYAIPNMSVDLHSPMQPVKPLWWRSVGHTHTAYVMETLMDELATAAGKDPVEFRLALLGSSPRMAGVLKLAAEKARWGQAPAEGRAYGVAVHHSFNSYVAQVAEVSLGSDGLPKVHKVVCAVDCGIAVNPDQIAAQMEGGIGFALAAALYGEVEVKDGRAVQSNFHNYQVLRMNQMPQVEVHIVESDEAPTGVGEPGVPPLAPAVANAVYRLSGQRVRQLPFSKAGLTAA